MKRKKILVVGDLFLDRYVYYDPNLGQPSLETGIKPVVAVKEKFAPGAAGNVAKALSLFGAEVKIVSVIGEDGNALELIKALRKQKIDDAFLVKSDKRPTPVYTKFINVETGKEDLPRLDLLPTKPLTKKMCDELVQKLNQALKWADAVVIVDQMENPKMGILTPEIKELLDKAKDALPKHFFVDSRSRAYVFAGYTLKPNLREFREIASHFHLLKEEDENELPNQIIAQRYAIKASNMLKSDLVITASEDGAYVVKKGEILRIFPIPVNVVDVTGGGDAFMAGMVIATLSDKNEKADVLIKAASIGLKASALCVSQQGTGEFDLDDVLRLPEPRIEKILSKEIFVNHFKKARNLKFALFDFDGTLSLLREGWQFIMKEVMIEAITGNKTLPEEELLKLENEVEDFIDRTTGQQTILQMIELEQMVRNYGFVPQNEIKTPLEYKKIYNQRLKKVVRERVKEGQTHKYLLKGAYEFLADLRSSGIKMLAASGTDVEDVMEEAEILGIKDFFDSGIYGAVGADYKKHSKAAVIKRLLAENNLHGEELVVFGDGPVEISVGKDFGAFTVGVASNEKKGYGWNLKKFQRLKNSGADILIPDFTVRNELEKVFLNIT